MTASTSTVSPLDVTLAEAVRAAQLAGDRLAELFSLDSRPESAEDIAEAGARNDEASRAVLRAALESAWPDAGWIDDEYRTAALEEGAWWVTDATEGNVNHIHGVPEWAVTAALVIDSVPVLAVVHEPVWDRTWTGIRGAGAWCNDRRLHVSTKTDLAVSIATTGQAEPGQTRTYGAFGASVTAMLGHVAAVRAAVPTTFPLLLLAGGHSEIFWQYEPVLSGVMAGMLLVSEAGGVISDIDGAPWRPGAGTFLAAAPGVHAQAVGVLAEVGRP